MIQVSKAEAKIIRKHLPHVHMKSTVHKCFAEETPELMRFLRTGHIGKDVKKRAQ